MINGWLNIYKPRGISSAKIVSIVKRYFKPSKVGHTGTLDLEAEGVLPIAIGEATKLVRVLIDAKKQYGFTIQFGKKTDTADSSGRIIDTTEFIPSKDEVYSVCKAFIGEIMQTPPAYSALKVQGKRAYKLARAGQEVNLNQRKIKIYNLYCTGYNIESKTASYICECSKGTYIRTLAEDISLSLQSLGFVIELRRLKVGNFTENNSVMIPDSVIKDQKGNHDILSDKYLKIETVLDDIPVLDIINEQAKQIRFGQKCYIDHYEDSNLVWVRYNNKIVAIGSLCNNYFKSSRVFNL